MSLVMRRRIAILSALGAAAAAWLVWRFPPGSSSLFPRCPIYETFHLYCPGCGGTRAVHALLHGRLADALHFNPLLVVLLPFLLFFLAVAWVRAMRDTQFRWPDVPAIWVKTILVAALLFAVVRNLPHRW
jgi:hypothetical protein